MGIRTSHDIHLKSHSIGKNIPVSTMTSSKKKTRTVPKSDGFGGLFEFSDVAEIAENFVEFGGDPAAKRNFTNKLNKFIDVHAQTSGNYWPAAQVGEFTLDSRNGSYHISFDRRVRESKMSGIDTYTNTGITLQKRDKRLRSGYKHVGGIEVFYNDSPGNSSLRVGMPALSEKKENDILKAMMLYILNS